VPVEEVIDKPFLLSRGYSADLQGVALVADLDGVVRARGPLDYPGDYLPQRFFPESYGEPADKSLQALRAFCRRSVGDRVNRIDIQVKQSGPQTPGQIGKFRIIAI
jgi:hypothetical protein